MPKSRDFVNFKSNDTVTVEIEEYRGEQEFSGGANGAYTKFMYDVLVNGKPMTIGATKGLQKSLESIAAKAGDVISITRTGTGLDTRWGVGLERGDSSASPRGPDRAVRPGATIDDLWATFDGFRGALQIRYDKLSEAENLMLAGMLTNAAFSGGILFHGFGAGNENAGKESSGKVSPHEFVLGMMKKARVPTTQDLLFAQFLFGDRVEKVEDINSEDAMMVYALTENGANPKPLAEQYDQMMADLSGDDEDTGLPF